jgi:hypothetical protein
MAGAGKMRETEYAREIAVGAHTDYRIERLHIKALDREEIRFSWWPDGKFIPRPLDVTEEELLLLLAAAIERKVFSSEFLGGLHEALGRLAPRQS